ncbi:MAG: translation initiation factor IF-2 [Flavobacteriales bacterium]|nr:translation initiation factor IF-2 [Flavobacteriales bacterium]
MSEVSKPVRLSKAAREFNLGLDTIVEFLASKGIEIERKPNTKLEPEQYALVRANFADEKAAKEKAKQKSKTLLEMEAVAVDSKKKAATEPESEPAPASEPDSAPAPVAEPEPKSEPEPVKEEPVAEPQAEVTAEDKPPVAEEKPAEEEPNAGAAVKVVGKVDLDAVAPKKKTKKSAAKQKEAPAEAPEAQKAAPEVPAPEAAAPEAEEQQPEAPTPEAAEVVRAKAEKLSGPTVVGKIELPVEKTPTTAGEKRKRKRITKVDVEAAGKQAGKRDRTVTGAPRKEISDKDIQKEIKETLARLSKGKKTQASAKTRRAKRDAKAERAEREQLAQMEAAHTLELTEFVTASELATMMDISVNEVISACMSLGMMVSINQRLDKETIGIIAEEFGYGVDFVSAEVQEAIEVEVDSDDDLVSRPPIVTVMGHVDHGKTSLLDYIRNTNVIDGEAGGITQHIGSYSVELEDGARMTFIDTPGHEAFTAMRARGAQVTDLAIIIVAADDAVMPQTKEAISHAQSAEIPFLIAINKCDREESNPDKIRTELAELGIQVEEWGGKTQSQEISAKTGMGIPELLEKVTLEAELLELKANPEKRAVGTIIESSLDKGRGYVTNLIVSAGTLRVGDAMLAGQYSGKVRAMTNERGEAMKEAGPSTPVSVLGLDGAPNAGDEFHIFEGEREARTIAQKRQQLQREQGIRTQKQVTLEELGRRIAVGEFKELNLIIKGDVDGSTEALADSLLKLTTEKVQVNVIHKAVGQISESDVLLASASEAIIIGFQVRPSGTARKLAEKEGIQIRLYSIIYQAIEEMKEAMEGLLSAKIEERITGTAEIRETFKISKVGTIAGCFVTDGTIHRNHGIRVIREGIVVYTGELGSLKRFKDDAKEVKKGLECGLNVEKFNDIKVGDIIEAYEEVEVKQTLDD